VHYFALFVYHIPYTIGCKAVLRMGSIANNKNDGESIAITDNGNYIVDLFFTTAIADVALAAVR
jgi:ribose 5-phosphate isomerase A